MTDQELHDLIFADIEASALADAGNDEGAALRARAIAPKVAVETRMTYLGIMSELGSALGARLITSVDAAAASGHAVLGPVLSEVKHSLRNSGVDLAHADTHSVLDTLVQLATPNGLTADDAAAIKALAETAPNITATMVSRVWSVYRPDGIIGGN